MMKSDKIDPFLYPLVQTFETLANTLIFMQQSHNHALCIVEYNIAKVRQIHTCHNMVLDLYKRKFQA